MLTKTRFSCLAGRGGADLLLDRAACRDLLVSALDQIGPLRRVLVVPPDFTRYHSGAGELTVLLDELLGPDVTVDILPALGTHSPMTAAQIQTMFPGLDPARFLVHDWRGGIVRRGVVPADFVQQVSEGRVAYDMEIAVSRYLVEGDYDLILSVGQVVPHEVIGLANQNKNLFVGVGGSDIINKSHFLGAAYGMERIMGRADTPVRRVFDYAAEHFCGDLPICYALTVRERLADGGMVTRGLWLGDDRETYLQAARLAQQVNLDLLDAPLERVVVWLDPDEFKSTWLGNKAVYRTRMALAAGGELLILAPGLREFGEDAAIDALIRKYGYRGTPATLAAVEAQADLRANLSAAAHLIHGSSEDRFRITYCPGHLTRAEVEGANFAYGDLATAIARYRPEQLRDGWNTLPDGERFFFIANPATGLWALRSAFEAA
ncbi:MAG: DUF2088 domain-containing protein [Fimbriimonadaceae bacterium]|nr:DUF2088 domain-containing protein [Fimbriimonadaceae bacterium]